jgi:hypothetical protein
MVRTCCLLNAVVIGLMAPFFSCGDGSDKQKSLEDNNWRLIIHRADGRIETHLSADPPYQCTSTENPKVLYFCGTIVGETPRGAWDFLPVYVDAGDTYSVATPLWLTPVPTPTTPTPTVIAP